MQFGLKEIAWMFFTYGLVGWLWETPYVSLKKRKFINRGFLRSPFIPIYGFAVTTVMLFAHLLEPLLEPGRLSSLLLMMGYVAAVATIWEYGTSWLMEVLFKTRWWDYSGHRFNLKGRISLKVSIFWGIGGTLLWTYVNEPVLNVLYAMSDQTAIFLMIGIYSVLAIDFAFTLSELIDLRNVAIKLHNASEEVVDYLTIRMENALDNIEELTETLSENVTDNLINQRAHFSQLVQDARQNLKLRVNYRRYEGFQAFTEFIEDMAQKGKAWAMDDDAPIARFKELLTKMKAKRRFFKNYPDAMTSEFQLMFLTRKIEAMLKELKRDESQHNGESHRDEKR